MPTPRVLPIPSRVVLLLDRLVGIGWLFLAFATIPILVKGFEPGGLCLDLLLGLGGPIGQGVVVDAEMTNVSIDRVPVWEAVVALQSNPEVLGVGYTTGVGPLLGETVSLECAVVGCDLFFRPLGARSTQLPTGFSAALTAYGLAFGLWPLRALWRRRWWIRALREGVAARGWVERENGSEEAVQWVEVQFDDLHDARWRRRCWTGYRKGGLRTRGLRVLYMEGAPHRAVVLEELQDWMGTRIPAAGEAWPLASSAAWLRVAGGLGLVVGWCAFLYRVFG